MFFCPDGPITISQPHFLYAPYYLGKTQGLSPNKGKHGTYLELEPESGLILRASRRMQVNVDLRRNGAINGLHNVPELQFPVLWVEEVNILMGWALLN